MSLQFQFTHHIAGAGVLFTGGAKDAQEALATIRAVVGEAATPVGGSTKETASVKNDKSTKADTVKSSPAERTQTASDNSANSSKDTAADDGKTQDAKTPNYDEHVKPLVLQISKKSREHALALLQRHGAIDANGNPSAKVLKPAQYAAFIKDAEAVIAGTLDPTQSKDGEMA